MIATHPTGQSHRRFSSNESDYQNHRHGAPPESFAETVVVGKEIVMFKDEESMIKVVMSEGTAAMTPKN